MKLLMILWNNRTTTFGFMQVTVAALATMDGIFTPAALKSVLVANALLTTWLGFFNNSRNRQSAPSSP